MKTQNKASDKKILKFRIEKLDELASLTEQTINGLYSPDDKMWDIGLGFRDKVQKEITKLKIREVRL